MILAITMSSDAAKVRVRGIIEQLKACESPEGKAGMARFGIKSDRAFGISIVTLRKMAKDIGRDHELALALWDTGFHEAMILASLVDDPALVTEKQLDNWVAGFDSWDVCDQCCSNLFDKTEFGYKKAFQWADDEREFVRRAGFVMMAVLSVHDRKAGDEVFEEFFPVIRKYAYDNRNFVRKAVNWALRQIGKRNLRLNGHAVEVALEIQAMNSKSARWIAADALRELQSDKVGQRLGEKSRKKCPKTK